LTTPLNIPQVMHTHTHTHTNLYLTNTARLQKETRRKWTHEIHLGH